MTRTAPTAPALSSPTLSSPTEGQGEEFRRAMGRIPTGIAIVSSLVEGAPVGMTVASLTHVSSAPPLVAFFAQKTSVTAQQVIAAGTFAASVLARGQDEVCYRFASSKGPKFTGFTTDFFADGMPKIPGAVLWLECDIVQVLDAGDHVGVLAAVRRHEVPENHNPPLAFYKSRVTSLDPAAGRHTPTERLQWW